MRVSSVATMTSARDWALWQRSHDVLDEGLAGDQGQRFAGKPGGTVAGRDDADDFHGEPEWRRPNFNFIREV